METDFFISESSSQENILNDKAVDKINTKIGRIKYDEYNGKDNKLLELKFKNIVSKDRNSCSNYPPEKSLGYMLNKRREKKKDIAIEVLI